MELRVQGLGFGYYRGAAKGECRYHARGIYSDYTGVVVTEYAYYARDSCGNYTAMDVGE